MDTTFLIYFDSDNLRFNSLLKKTMEEFIIIFAHELCLEPRDASIMEFDIIGLI